MTQLDLALAAKAEGLERAEFNSGDFVPRMRAVAKAISAMDGEVHIDQLREVAAAQGWRPRTSQAWGSVFAEKGWVRIGERASRWPSNHGHRSPVWRWEGGQ